METLLVMSAVCQSLKIVSIDVPWSESVFFFFSDCRVKISVRKDIIVSAAQCDSQTEEFLALRVCEWKVLQCSSFVAASEGVLRKLVK